MAQGEAAPRGLGSHGLGLQAASQSSPSSTGTLPTDGLRAGEGPGHTPRGSPPLAPALLAAKPTLQHPRWAPAWPWEGTLMDVRGVEIQQF